MTQSQAGYRPIYSWTVVGLAALAYIVSNIDRQLISVLVVPLERDLRLRDTEFGALQGVAYSLFYAAACVPIAGLSDRFSRSRIMSVGLTLWSAATMACGMVNGFWTFFFFRALVGIEESSLLPAVYSLVGDLFPREKLGRAMGTFFLAPFIGATAAFTLGGLSLKWLGEDGTHLIFGHAFATWQLTFLMAGLPGFVLALAIAVLVPDPRLHRQGRYARAERPPFRDVLRHVGRERRVFIPVLVGYPLLAIPFYVILGWASAYLVRTSGLTSAQAGVWLGAAVLIIGCCATLTAGFLSDVLVARGRIAAPSELGVMAASLMSIVMVVALLAPFHGMPFVVVITGLLCGCFSLAPSAAIIQTFAPAEYRSRVTALFLIGSLLWQTLGNIVIGLLNDWVFSSPKGIGVSLPLFVVISSTAAAFVLNSGRRALLMATSPNDVM